MAESLAARARAVDDALSAVYPDAHCALNHDGPYQLLVATVLSAQTTDARVNTVTPELFTRFPDAAALAAADPEELEAIIRPLGMQRTRAERLIGLGLGLSGRFDGVVPSDRKALASLPGVGRKTANVVLGNAFDKPGFPVDTHVIRVTGRLHWRSDWASPTPDPVAIEREITACFPPSEWTDLSHRLIMHGRTTCHARKPDCLDCPLNDTCPSAFKV